MTRSLPPVFLNNIQGFMSYIQFNPVRVNFCVQCKIAVWLPSFECDYPVLPWQLSWQRIHLQCRRPQFNSWVRKIPWRRDRLPTSIFLGFPGDLDSKASYFNAGDLGLSLSWEDPLEEGMATPLQYLPGESHGQRSLTGYSPWGCKKLDMTELLSTANPVIKLGEQFYWSHRNRCQVLRDSLVASLTWLPLQLSW